MNDKLRVRGLTKLLTKAEALEILADQWTRIYPYLDEHLPIEYRRTSWDLESSKWLASHWSEIHKNVPGSLGEYSMISYLHDAAGISRDVGRSMLMDIYSKKNPYHEILAKEFQKEKLYFSF